jgi:hypothetical protein
MLKIVKTKDTFRMRNLLTPLSAILALTALSASAPQFVQAQQVYVGIADQWDEMNAHPDQWSYVRHNADGFYINFIEMHWAAKGQQGHSQETLNRTASLFTHKNAYFESDYHLDGQNEADDDLDIDMLQKAGFKVPYTSLNTGWDARRYRNLKTYHLLPNQKPRYSFVQDGPWTIDGDIKGDISNGGLFSNAEYRRQMDGADGVSTDGPLGYWFHDPGVGFNKMQSGSFSMVNYAHAEGKPAVVMLCPYGAGVSDYDAKTMYVSTGEDCVRRHEDADAEPQVWDVFEYATTIGAVPEQVNGAPAQNSTTAMAYYLIKHIKGDPATLHLTTSKGAHNVILKSDVPVGRVNHFILNVADTSGWLDYAAVLKGKRKGSSGMWDVHYKLKGRDITPQVLGAGFKFYQRDRINPASSTAVDLYLTRISSHGSSGLRLTTELLPHQGQPVMDRVILVAPSRTH